MAELSWPAPTPRDEVLARVVTRGRRIQMLNRFMIGGAVAVAATAAGVGLWLGVSGAVDLVGDDGAAPAVVTPQGGDDSGGGSAGAVAYFACPNERELGELHGGDRVYLTGRDESGDWVELRSPLDASIPVWVRAEVVDPDGDADLPEVDCDLTELALGATPTTTPEETPEQTTTTTEPDDEPSTPTTTRPSTTPTTSQPPVTPPTTPTPTTTSTTQPPAAPPVIGTISRSPGAISERYDDGTGYSCGNPSVTSISVQIPGAASATLSWNLGPHPRAMTMDRQGSWFFGEIGPFDETTVPKDGSMSMTVTVNASGPGGSDVRSTSVTLNDCTFG